MDTSRTKRNVMRTVHTHAKDRQAQLHRHRQANTLRGAFVESVVSSLTTM